MPTVKVDRVPFPRTANFRRNNRPGKLPAALRLAAGAGEINKTVALVAAMAAIQTAVAVATAAMVLTPTRARQGA